MSDKPRALDDLSLCKILKLRWLLWRARRNLAAFEQARVRWRSNLEQAERIAGLTRERPPIWARRSI